MSKKNIAIIGCGAMGSALAEYVDKELTDRISKIVLFDIDDVKVDELSRKLTNCMTAYSVNEAVENSDLVVEVSNAAAVSDILGRCIDKNRDIVIMSIGGILSDESLLDKARDKNVRVILPSGAIAGIDAVKSAKLSGIETVTLTTRKSPKSLQGAPYLEANDIDLDMLSGENIIFEGTAREAIEGFPKNVNVSSLLSLAGIGADKTMVRIVVSPEYKKNIHEIEVVSNSGKLIMRTENVPSPTNPKTSYLAILAAEEAVKEYFDSVRFGT